MALIQITLILALCLASKTGDAARSKDNMYDPINAFGVCFRRMNATHQTGCSSDSGGSTGVIHYVTNSSDLETVLTEGTAGSYVAVLPITMLASLVDRLIAAGQEGVITGVIVHKVNETISRMSHEDLCPNRPFNLEGTCDKDWNKYGTGLLQADFPFPVVYLYEDSDISKVRNCFEHYNNFDLADQRDRSLCSLELSTFMLAAVDTPTCLRRSNSVMNLNPVKFCDPLGDQNVWGSLFPLGNTTDHSVDANGSHVAIPVLQPKRMRYVFVAARIDTTSLFLDIDSGAVNPMSSIVTLIATAQLLKKMLPVYDDFNTNVVFMLFNGETYDYIGSQRTLYDMNRDEFPTQFFKNEHETVAIVKPADIDLFIELNQMNVRLVNDVPTLHVHLPHEASPARDFVTKLKKYSTNLRLDEHVPSLPPGSLHTFLASDAPTKSNLSAVMLTDHGIIDGFTNPFYNNIYDDADNMQYVYLNLSETDEAVRVVPEHCVQQHVALVAAALAQSLYETVTGARYSGDVAAGLADVVMIDELFHCYLQNTSCKVHKAIQRQNLKGVSLSFYVSVPNNINLVTSLVGLALGWVMGDKIETRTGFCTPNMTSSLYRYFNMSTSLYDIKEYLMFPTSLNFTEAISPAFLIDDYDWKSGKYSSWSESQWRSMGVRMFLRPSAAHESMTMAVGSVTFVLASLLVYFVKTRSHILFATPAHVSATSC